MVDNLQGVNRPSYVTNIAPEKPMIADPIINICKCLFTTFLPIAFAASSLSRIALIILPHGDLRAFSENTNIVIKTIEKITLKHSFTKILDEVMTSSF